MFRRVGRTRRVEFLCVRRAAGRWLPGAWQPVTGKRRRGETATAAAKREVREETGLEPRRWWALESPAVFYQADRDELIAVPLFAAEVAAGDEVRLSREHVAWAFLTARAAGRRFVWDAQRRALEDVRRQVLDGGRLAAALELPSASRARRRRS